MKTTEPQPVKYFIGALFSDATALEKAISICEKEIGIIDLRGDDFPFEHTRYYNDEMGQPIFRTFLSFEGLISPGELATLKVLCNDIEKRVSTSGARKVNLDIGYLDFHKVILASAKYNGQKIYLDQGIYADPTLVFEGGQFKSMENTFPDFKTGDYSEVFTDIRNRYKAQLRAN